MSITAKSALLVPLLLAAALPMQVRTGTGAAAAPATGTAKVTILLLNGKNGHPMRHHIVNVYVYRRMPPNYSPESDWELRNRPLGWMVVRTNRDGRFTFPVPARGAVGEAEAGFSVSCLPPLPDKTPVSNVLYPVSRILSHGIVTENTCGKGRATPKPGVLVIFARPMTFWERLRT